MRSDTFSGESCRQFLSAGILVAVLAASAGGSAQAQPDEVVEIDGKLWSLVTSDGAVPWNEAEEFCETLEAGGYTDWRLPTLLELETLHDPAAAQSVRGPFSLSDCCAWSSQNLAQLPAERKGELPDPAGPPGGYYWGFLFDGGVRYYANGRFDDGFAMCTREPQQG